MLQPTKLATETERGVHLTTKVVTKRLKSGEVKRYRYYQEVRSYREGRKVKHEYVRYIGKEPPPRVTVNRGRDVTANYEEHDPLVPPEKRPTKAICARCGREFVLTWIERHLGHELCTRCRAEVLRER